MLKPSPRKRILELLPWFATGIVIGMSFLSLPNGFTAVGGIASALVLAGLYRRNPRPSRWAPLALGYGTLLVGMHWIPEILSTFVGLSGVASWLFMLAFVGVSSLQFVLMNWVFLALSPTALARYALPLPLAWWASEFVMPKVFPWELGQTQLALPFAQVSDLLGSSLVSFLLLWWSSLCVGIVLANRSEHRRHLVGALSASVVLVFGYSILRVQQVQMQIQEAPELSVALVQGNLDPRRDFRNEAVAMNIERYRALSVPVVSKRKPDLLIWPESSFSRNFLVGETRIDKGGERDPIPNLDVPILFGSQILVPSRESEGNRYYNSAVLITSSGRISGMYRKQHLFPFSEKLPFANTFPWLEKLVPKNYILLAGRNEKPLELELSNGHTGLSARIATVICYEDLRTDLFRKMIREDGANLLLGLTNDNWFKRTVASQQHHMLATARAIETRRFLLRSTNSGLTGIVDPLGRTLARLPSFDHGALVSREVRLMESRTLYVRLGDGPLWVLALATLAFAAFASRMRKRGPAAGNSVP